MSHSVGVIRCEHRMVESIQRPMVFTDLTLAWKLTLILNLDLIIKNKKLPLPTSQAENDALIGAASQANYWLAIAQFRDFNDTIGNIRTVESLWYNVNTGELWASEGLGKRFRISNKEAAINCVRVTGLVKFLYKI